MLAAVVVTAAASPDPHGTAEIRARIRAAMHEASMTQGELGLEAGLSKFAINRLLSGERDISAGELGLLAEALGRSLSWLVGDELAHGSAGAATGGAPGAAQVASRTYAFAARLVERAADTPALRSVTTRAITLIETEAELDLLVATDAPALPDRPPLPTTTFKKIAGREMATRVRGAFRLGDEPIADLTAFAWSHFGLRVAREPLDAGIDGLLTTDTHNHTDTRTADGAVEVGAVPPLAVVNTLGRRLGRQRFTAAHELGHLLFGDAHDDLHTDYNRMRDKDHVELRANEFATELLAPASGVLALADHVAGDRSAAESKTERGLWCRQAVADVAAHFGVSVESAIIRCEVLGLITQRERAQVESVARQGVTALLHITGHEAYAEADEAATGVTDPPESLSGKALYAYGEGLVGLGVLGRVWNTDDLLGLRADLTAAGWAPAER